MSERACPFAGSLVALPTPFEGAELDLEAFAELVEEHAAGPSDGIVVAGTTGEAATLRFGERVRLFELAVGQAKGRLHVLGGVGTNDTGTTRELAQAAAEAGVDGLLVVTPYYNRPSPRGLRLHFGSVAGATPLPVVLYNVPSRTGVDLEPGLARELASEHGTIFGLKEANADPERIRRVAADSGLAVFAGEDASIADFRRHGAVGAISVVGNLVPAEVAELVRVSGPGGDLRRAEELTEYLAPLIAGLFVEVNPVPVKAALSRLGRLGPTVRAPLAPLEEGHAAELESVLRASGLLG